ncbi:MAG: histidine kinase [Bacteroidetes bacterium]|nr:histidine kinase [Bacteroidota bacterium]
MGVSLVSDRFGNERSAVYTHGHATSYLSLGTSKLLKSPVMTISLWVNFDRRVYSGKGDDYNPILCIKNSESEDFCNAIVIAYDCKTGRIGISSTKDSTKEVNILSSYPIKFNQWYHLVFVCNNNYLAFYVNGKLEGKSNKNFETKILYSDSVVIGHSARKKNERYSQAIFDDIQFFHRSLSEKEALDLYNAPNPNKTKQFWMDMTKYIAIILLFALIIIIIVIRNKRNLKKQKEQYELHNRIAELEIKVIKNQMNPHFISNCLAAIQELIYTENYKKAAQYIAKFSFFLRQVLQY